MVRNNNFDFLRLLFSFLVVIGHSIILSKMPEFQNVFLASMPTYSVFGFFIISGFLVYSSFDRLQNIKKYAINRAKRILPAYIFVVLFFAVILFFFSSNSFSDYFSFNWGKYTIVNLLFLNFLKPCIDWVFTENLVCAVNGSLWTIKVEIMFYIFVPFLYYLLRNRTLKSQNTIIIILYVLSLTYYHYTGKNYGGFIAKQLPGTLSYFLSGIFLYLNLAFFSKRWVYFVIPAVIIIIIEKVIFSTTFLFPFAFGLIIIWVAFSKIPLRNFAKYGDFSYGLYLTHFPIIQIFTQLNIYNKYSFVGLFASFSVILLFSILIWKFIEKPFLQKKKIIQTPVEGLP